MPPRRKANIGRRTRHANAQRVNQAEITQPSNDSNIVSEFDTTIKSWSYSSCTVCKENHLNDVEIDFICNRCKKHPTVMTASNNMDPGEVPEALIGVRYC